MFDGHPCPTSFCSEQFNTLPNVTFDDRTSDSVTYSAGTQGHRILLIVLVMAELKVAAAEGLRLQRARRRLYQKDVAAALGVTERTAGYLEAGRRVPNIVELATICGLLDVTLGELLASGGASPTDLARLGI